MDKGKAVAQSTGDADGNPNACCLKSRIYRREKGKSVGQSSTVADDVVEDTPPQNSKFAFTITAKHLSGKIPLALPIEFVRVLMKRMGEDKDPKFIVTLTANYLLEKTLLLIPAYFLRENILPIGRPKIAQLVVEGEKPVTCPLVWESNRDNKRPVKKVYPGHAWKIFCEDHGLFDGLELEFTMSVVGGQIQF